MPTFLVIIKLVPMATEPAIASVRPMYLSSTMANGDKQGPQAVKEDERF
jgi:hypothetical protein